MSRETAEFSERLKSARERLIATNISDPALAVCIAGLGRLAFEEVIDTLADHGRPSSTMILSSPVPWRAVTVPHNT